MHLLIRAVQVACAIVLLLPALGVVPAGAQQAELPSWQHLPLTNARTGETFTLADFVGMTVYVGPMATWCTTCRQQLGEVREARAQVDAQQIVFLALSVEPDLPDETLARYADDSGFEWLFAVATPELLQELSGTFGLTIANPPATPHFIIAPDGSTSALSTGIHPADAIIQQLQAASGG